MHRFKPRIEETILAHIRAVRLAHALFCPDCWSRRVIRWGFSCGRQRYRCKECGLTFNELTGTPAAYIKKIGKWIANAACMRDSLTIRRTAALLGVHSTTAFRWRHGQACFLRCGPIDPIVGWIYLELLNFAFSRKGERGKRPPRRLPGNAQGPDPGVRVVVATDLLGNCRTELFYCPPVTTNDLQDALRNCSFSDGIIAGPGLFPQARTIGVRKRVQVLDGRLTRRLPARAPHAGMGPALTYASRLLDWLEKFCGVATKYLANYLAWHVTLDRQVRHSFESTLLRSMLRT